LANSIAKSIFWSEKGLKCIGCKTENIPTDKVFRKISQLMLPPFLTPRGGCVCAPKQQGDCCDAISSRFFEAKEGNNKGGNFRETQGNNEAIPIG